MKDGQHYYNTISYRLVTGNQGRGLFARVHAIKIVALDYWGKTRIAECPFPKKIHTGFIYTMNVTEEQIKEYGFDHHLIINENMLQRVFGASETLCSFDTYQFEDYSKVVANRFDPEKKAKRRQEVFPNDCKKVFEMGVKFAQQGIVDND